MKPLRMLVLALVSGAVLLASLTLMSAAMHDSAWFGQIYGLLLAVNALGLVVLGVLTALNVRQLVRDLRAGAPGARLRLRMVGMFALLALVPVTIVYGFSLDFLSRGIDSWFDVHTEQAMQDSLQLTRNALDLRMRELLRQTEQMAAELTDRVNPGTALDFKDLEGDTATIVSNTIEFAGSNLDALRQRSGAEEIALLSRKGSALEFSSASGDFVPSLPPQTVLLQLRQGQSYIGLDPVSNAGLYIRVVVNVPNIGLASDARLLQALFPVAPRMNELAGSVEKAFADYREVSFLRRQLKVGFVMTLTLVLASTVLGALWAAFYSAGRLAEPIQDLAEGTRAVADGRYETWVPPAANDELGFLVRSFNDMTRSIRQARDEARTSRDQVEAERAYLKAVLLRLTSGVLTFDTEGRLRTANPSAEQILGNALSPHAGANVATLRQEHPSLLPFWDRLAPHLAVPGMEWQEQVVLFGASGRQILMCRGAALTAALQDQGGHVVVFDDVTALIQAQKNAAWSEVARRLAHEIKNPLTPIQLSAERLRHKYLRNMGPADAEVLDRLTSTIVQQVETLKQMVNTFSEYARTPKMQPAPVRLGTLVQDLLELYRSLDRRAELVADIDPDLPEIEADAGRMRQVLNNLLKNAFEAAPPESPVHVTVTARGASDASNAFVELRVADRGAGIDPAMLPNVFEPYVTTKPKGTGLGLAIVRKIVEEHGGSVWMENTPAGGACVVLRLPTVLPRAIEGDERRHVV